MIFLKSDFIMAKYRPENRDKIKYEATDLTRKANDHVRHMTYTVKDAAFIADASRKMKSPATLEGAKEITQCFRQAKKAVEGKAHEQRKDIETIINKENKVVNELRDRTKDSLNNYRQMIKSSGGIKETPAARDKINRAGHAARNDACFTDTLRKRTGRNREHTEKKTRQLGGELKKILLSVGTNDSYWSIYRMHEVEKAVDDVKGGIKKNAEGLEGEVIASDEHGQNHDFCKPAKDRFEAFQSEIERLKQRHQQNPKPPVPDHDYGAKYPNPLDEKYK